VAREVLPATLAQAGIQVKVVGVYQARQPPGIPEEARPFVDSGQIDILTFASSATVNHFAALVGQEKISGTVENSRGGRHRPYYRSHPSGLRPHPVSPTRGLNPSYFSHSNTRIFSTKPVITGSYQSFL
jgi:hypothetical protein